MPAEQARHPGQVGDQAGERTAGQRARVLDQRVGRVAEERVVDAAPQPGERGTASRSRCAAAATAISAPTTGKARKSDAEERVERRRAERVDRRRPPLSAANTSARPRSVRHTGPAEPPSEAPRRSSWAILFGRVLRPQGVRSLPRARPAIVTAVAVDSRSTSTGSEPRTCERGSRPSSSSTSVSTAAAPSSDSGIATVVTGGERYAATGSSS